MNIQGLIGKKSYQTQGFLEDGTRVPLSAVILAENLVSQVKTQEKEGYNAVQIAFGEKRKTTKALQGHGKKAGLEKNARFFREIRVEDTAGFEPGAKINVNDVFKPGDIVDVTGVSKGKGWAGVVKKWHFRGGPRTHGQSDRERAPGSIGQTTTPGRVYRGKKMAGKMGSETATVKNLEITEVTNDGVLLIKGLIPGYTNGLVMVKKVGENKKFVPLYKEISKEEEVSEPSEGQETQEASPEPVVEEAPVLEENPEQSSEPVVSSPANEQPAVSEDKGTIEEASEATVETAEKRKEAQEEEKGENS